MKKELFEGIDCEDAFGAWEFEGGDEQVFCRTRPVKQVGKTVNVPDR